MLISAAALGEDGTRVPKTSSQQASAGLGLDAAVGPFNVYVVDAAAVVASQPPAGHVSLLFGSGKLNTIQN